MVGLLIILASIASNAVLAMPQVSPTCPNGVCPGLGRLFYLPEVNAMSINTGGTQFLKNTTLGECAKISQAHQATRTFRYSDSMQHLVQATSTSVGVDASYKTAELNMKGSIRALAGSSSSMTSTFHSVHLDVTVTTAVVDLDNKQACLGVEQNFNTGFMETFKAIPLIKSNEVSKNGAWAPYVNFMKDWGSHIMMQQKIGSRVQQWESTTSNVNQAAQTLQMKACANVEGLSAGGGWSVSGCAAYTKQQKMMASSTQTQSNRIILGGTRASRAAITADLTQSTLEKFIADAEMGDQPIEFSYKPIWEILKSYYTTRCAQNGKASADCDHKQRAYNLQAAFEGWQAVGCPERGTTNGVRYQFMGYLDPNADTKLYGCWNAKTGCHDDNDCHLGGAGSVCYCYGNSCFDSGSAVSGTSEIRTKVRAGKTGSTYDGVNNACYYKFLAHCNCNQQWSGGLPARWVYSQASTPSRSADLSLQAAAMPNATFDQKDEQVLVLP